MEHQTYEELLTLQALDALEPADRRKLEAHLETCPTCRGEFVELRDAAGLMAHASTLAEPGAEVRARILQEVNREGRQAPAPRLPVVPFRVQAAKSVWPNFLRLAAGLALVGLLLGVVVLWQREAKSRREIARLSEQIKQQDEQLSRDREALTRQREAVELMNSPHAKKMELAGTQTSQFARATFVYDQASGRAMLMTDGLPSAPAGMAYEVWFIPKGRAPMPGKVFKVDSSGHAMMLDQMPPEAMDNGIIAVTLEPEKGSASPTGAIYLSSSS